MRIRLLGGFSVSVGSRVIGEDEWRLKKVRGLIKLLALAENHQLHREQITNLLWPDLDEKPAVNNLHSTLHSARRVLEITSSNTASSYLALRGDLVELCPDGQLWVDVEAFESAAATARHGRKLAAYQAAIDLYAGGLLPEDRYEDWASDRREELRRSYLALITELAGLHEERGDHGSAIEALRRALVGSPTHEEASRGLMRLYAASEEGQRAIAEYEQLQRTLSREEPGVEPEDASRRLYEEIVAGWYPKALSRFESRPTKEPANNEHNRPNAPSSFVEREMVGIKRSLAMTGVLTLTGTGGSGKTRLALEVARDLVGAYPDGVWFVELAPLADPALVPLAVAAALDVSEQPGRPLIQTLSNYLRSRQMLLVLDNCEHLVDACARLVDALLGSCPELRVLATRREALGVAGEANWPLSPCPCQRQGPPTAENTCLRLRSLPATRPSGSSWTAPVHDCPPSS